MRLELFFSRARAKQCKDFLPAETWPFVARGRESRRRRQTLEQNSMRQKSQGHDPPIDTVAAAVFSTA